MGMENQKLYMVIGVAATVVFFLIFFAPIFSPILGPLGSLSPLQTPTAAVISNPAGATPQEEQQSSAPFDIVPGFVKAQDMQQGTGLLAEDGKTVFVGYRVSFLNDNNELVVADENLSKDQPLVFEVGSDRIIPGFNLGVVGMREGGVRHLQVHPQFAYGDKQAGSIPPNTELFFEIHLYEVR